MPTELLNYITLGFNEGGDAYGDFLSMKTSLNQAGVYLQAGDTLNAGGQLINAANELGAANIDLLRTGTYNQGLRHWWWKALLWINSNWTDGAEVTMDAIVNAMFSASFNQLEKFIGLIDAYRMALWNAPFNAEWYAAIARGFMKWP